MLLLQNLAASHRQLLQDVQQHCSRLPSVAAAAAVTPDDITWALSMVKSRTFARALPQQQQPVSDSSQGISSVNTSESQSSRQSQGLASNRLDEQQLDSRQQEMYDDDEADIMLLMVPFVDMINHAPESNCAFNLDWQNQWWVKTTSSYIESRWYLAVCCLPAMVLHFLLLIVESFTPELWHDVHMQFPDHQHI